MDFFLTIPLFFFVIVPLLLFYCRFLFFLFSTIKFFSGSGLLKLGRTTSSCSFETNNTTTAEGVEDHESKNPSSSNCTTLSKKAVKKEHKKLEKQRRQQKVAAAAELESDPLSSNYGDIPYHELQSKEVTKRKWTQIRLLGKELEGKEVLVRGRVQSIRAQSKITFLVLRQNGCTVQCVVSFAPGVVSKQMVKYVSSLNNESTIDVYGIVIHKEDIKSTTQKVELQVRKIYCISRAVAQLPINFEDAINGRVHRDTQLNHRVLYLRTPANHGIFRIQFYVENIFRNFLLSTGFVGIHTPKVIAGSSEGGSAVYKLEHNSQPACLAQSPQLHKQMTLFGTEYDGVFEAGSVFRNENSNTHRHLCEFIGLDVEMKINEHYMEVIDIVKELFVAIFDGLKENCKKELEAVRKQFPFEPLKYLPETLLLTFKEGVKMLKEAGVEIGDEDDLNTEAEKKLGQLVLERYNTDFYILHQYPLKVRPFYTMPCYDNPEYSNSFDVFMRGEEIISGAQRIHDPEHLRNRAEACGINVEGPTISAYIDSLRYGEGPHGGFGVGLERVVMLFCGLQNIRDTSLFPRDPKRIAP